MIKQTYSMTSLITLFSLLLFAVDLIGAELPMGDKLITSDDSGSIRMADNFFIVYDPSDEMAVPYRDTGLTRLEAEKNIIWESNSYLPELGWQAGLYPHWKGGLWLPSSPMAFKPYHPLQRYSRQTYAQAIDQLPTLPTGPAMLQRGLMKLEYLLGLPGRTEVFIFSTGNASTFKPMEPQPLEQAKKLADNFDVCFTIVSSAKEPEAQSLLESIASVNSCSQVIDFDTVYQNPEHLLGKLYAKSDNTFNNVHFDFDKSVIKAEQASTLDKLGQFLTDNPRSYAVLSGFTDNIGTEAYNIKLSQRRAESVQRYLGTHFKISESRLLLYWYGYANPYASNKSEEGRSLNRRVTITIRDKR